MCESRQFVCQGEGGGGFQDLFLVKLQCEFNKINLNFPEVGGGIRSR